MFFVMNSKVLNHVNEPLQYQPTFLVYTCTFHNLDFNTRDKPYMSFTFLVVVVEYVEV